MIRVLPLCPCHVTPFYTCKTSWWMTTFSLNYWTKCKKIVHEDGPLESIHFLQVFDPSNMVNFSSHGFPIFTIMSLIKYTLRDLYLLNFYISGFVERKTNLWLQDDPLKSGIMTLITTMNENIHNWATVAPSQHQECPYIQRWFLCTWMHTIILK